MTYDLSHWNNPRGSIANKFANNDFAYVSRGANIALYILKAFDITPSQAKDMTVLDYGCGTGRAAAFLSLMFNKSYGYDPNKFCIAEAFKENTKSEIKFDNVVLTTDWNDIPVCDIAFSTNVIEHLNEKDQTVMVKNLGDKVKDKSLLWYSPDRNPMLKEFCLDDWDAKQGGKIQIAFFDFRKPR